jgi:hypothetical protein
MKKKLVRDEKELSCRKKVGKSEYRMILDVILDKFGG